MMGLLLFAKTYGFLSESKKEAREMIATMAENLHDLHCETVNNLVVVPNNVLLKVDYRGSRQMAIATEGTFDTTGQPVKCSHCRLTFGGMHAFLLLESHEPEILGSFAEFILHPERMIVHEVMQAHGIQHHCDLVMARTIDSMMAHHPEHMKKPEKIKKVMRSIVDLDRFRDAAMMFGG